MISSENMTSDTSDMTSQMSFEFTEFYYSINATKREWKRILNEFYENSPNGALSRFSKIIFFDIKLQRTFNSIQKQISHTSALDMLTCRIFIFIQ